MSIGLKPADGYFASWIKENNFPLELFFRIPGIKNALRGDYLKEKTNKYLEIKDILEKKEGIIELFIPRKDLKGGLDLKGFKDLRKLNCSNNKITDLDLSDCPNLSLLNCPGNQLTNLNFLISLPLPENLTELNIVNNEFPHTNLSVFSRFKNLKMLLIAENLFYGSLEPLRDLNKLEILHI